LLIEPFPESALNEEAGKMLMEDYEGYAKHARYSLSEQLLAFKSAEDIRMWHHFCLFSLFAGPPCL
jgi:hypothetical protein